MAKTLKDIIREKQEMAERNDRPKVNWFSMGKKNPVRIQFLQELDTDSPGYDSNRGTGIFLVEHTSPHDFRRRAECSFDTEGRCFACEMREAEPYAAGPDGKQVPQWQQKTNLYVQVVDEEGQISVLSRNAYGDFVTEITNYASEENDGKITGVTFKVSKGEGKQGAWSLMPTRNEIEVPKAPELVDLEQAVGRKVKYDEQRRFYVPVESEKKDEEKVSAKASSKDEVSW